MNVYFQNVCLMLNPNNYAFDARSAKGMQLQERWTYTPAPDEAGDYPLTIEVRDASNKIVARGGTTVHVAQPRAGTAGIATLLMIGASLTERSIYPQHVFDLSVRDPYVLLKLVGSRGPDNMPPHGELRHEGYSGWTAEAFATRPQGILSRSGYYKGAETGSPFVYQDAQGRPVLDFKRYCDEFNAGKAPDFVTIQVGINDTWSATDETIDQRLDGMLSYYDQLVEMIHKVRADTKVGVFLVNPPSVSQDGFRNYKGSARQTRWQARRNQHRVVERLIAKYGSREREHIYLMPIYLNLDTENGYPTATSPVNSHSEQTVIRVSNGTHPNEAGYRQIGDVIFCWLKSMLDH
jgi:lysophospholipase L1-like esterase